MNIGEDILGGDKTGQEVNVPILGLYKSTGNIILFGDSNCLDNNHIEIGNCYQLFIQLYFQIIYHYFHDYFSDCYWMLDAILEYISTGKLPHVFLEDNVKISNNTTKYLTERLKDNDFYK